MTPALSSPYPFVLIGKPCRPLSAARRQCMYLLQQEHGERGGRHGHGHIVVAQGHLQIWMDRGLKKGSVALFLYLYTRSVKPTSTQSLFPEH